MKLLQYTLLIGSLAFSSPAFAQQNLKDNPANLNIDESMDLKTHKPTVNINIPKFLLKNALSEFDGGKNDPIAKLGIDINELIGGIKLVRLVVYEGIEDKDKRKAISKGAAALRSKLEQDWVPIVVVNEEKEKVMICAMGDASGEELAGLAMVVDSGNELVIGNLVGNVPIGKIAKIAVQLGKDMLPPEVLKQLKALQGGDPADDTHEHHEKSNTTTKAGGDAFSSGRDAKTLEGKR